MFQPNIQSSEICDIVLFPLTDLPSNCHIMMLPDSVVRLHDENNDNFWFGTHVTTHGYQPDRDNAYPVVASMLKTAFAELGLKPLGKTSLDQSVRRVIDTVCVQRRCVINGASSSQKYFAHMPLDRNIRFCMSPSFNENEDFVRGGFLYEFTFLGHKLRGFVYHLCTDITEKVTPERVTQYLQWHIAREFGHIHKGDVELSLIGTFTRTRVTAPA